MIRQPAPPFTRLAVAALLLLLPVACSMFDAAKVPPPAFYSLSGVGASPPAKAAAARLGAAPTLIVNPHVPPPVSTASGSSMFASPISWSISRTVNGSIRPPG